eukprot:c2879_g1_i1 orf=2-319(-)
MPLNVLLSWVHNASGKATSPSLLASLAPSGMSTALGTRVACTAFVFEYTNMTSMRVMREATKLDEAILKHKERTNLQIALLLSYKMPPSIFCKGPPLHIPPPSSSV